MDIERLFINGVEVDLYNNTTSFARTLQVNDLISLSTRQTNYTKNIKLPRTPKNQTIFKYIGDYNSSNLSIANEKLVVDYMVNNEYLIYQGWGVVESTTDLEISLNIYDGLIDLYKKIENISLADLDLSEIEHIKTLNSINNSIVNYDTSNYTYLIADYGGKNMHYFTIGGGTVNNAGGINIDYLVPSVKVSYLMNKIFEYCDSTYTGSPFETDEYKTLFLSYGNGYTVTNNATTYYSSSNLSLGTKLSNNDYSYYAIKHNQLTPLSGSFATNEVYVVPKTGVYQFIDEGVGTSKYDKGVYGYVLSFFWNFTQMIVEVVINDTVAYDITTKPQITLTEGDTVKITARAKGGNKISNITVKLNLKYIYVSGDEINFRNSLQNFKVKDFLNEVIYRYGLTIYKDKYESKYTFKTFDEILNFDESNIIDISSNYIKKITQSYTYGNYAQENIIKYKYNIENANYLDYKFYITNQNLDESKVVLQSKLYAKEEFQTKKMGFYTNEYKLWQQNVSDDGTITYNPSSNRFYFINSNKINANIMTVSQITNEYAIVNPFYLTTDVILTPYQKFEKMLNNITVINAEMKFSIIEVNNFDFSKLYYINQLGGYFLVNKIKDYQLNKTCTVELIKISN